MASKIRHFLERDGRYFSRITVPSHLKPFLGNKTELRKSLGGDKRAAVAQHTVEIAILQMRLAEAERQYQTQLANDVAPNDPWSIEEMASDNYLDRLAFDTELRATTNKYAQMPVDDHLASLYKRGYSGHLPDGELAVLVVHRINRYKYLGHTSAAYGTREWRILAMALCRSEYEALARSAERDEGDFSGQPTADFTTTPTPTPSQITPQVAPAPLAPETPQEEVSLQNLFDDYIAGRRKLGRGRDLPKRWQPVITDLIRFLGRDDARTIKKADIVKWRNVKLETLAPKTIKAVYLSCIQTVLGWAVENDILPTNEAASVKQEMPKQIRTREKGYTKSEAINILRAASAAPEAPLSLAIRRWVPWLCAFSGARVGEILQLRSEDIRWESKTLVLRLSPDAGTIETGEYRDVPVHSQVIEMGFDTFAAQASGPLFYTLGPSKDPLKAAQSSAATLRRWMARNELTTKGVAPNHGWRHHFKTFAREARIEDRVIDGITGHASKTAGDHYGDVTLLTMINAIESLPRYNFELPR